MLCLLPPAAHLGEQLCPSHPCLSLCPQGALVATLCPLTPGGSLEFWDPQCWVVADSAGFPLTPLQRGAIQSLAFPPNNRPSCVGLSPTELSLPQDCCLQPHGSAVSHSVILSFACAQAEYDFLHILYVECNTRK